jgi:hypothetical protein
VGQPPKTTATPVRAKPAWGWRFSNIRREEAFSPSKRKCPTPWGGGTGNPCAQGFPMAAFFWYFYLQKQRKVHKIFNKAKKSPKNEFLYRFLEKNHIFAKKSLTLSQKSDRILYY